MKSINQYIAEHMFSGKKVTVANQTTQMNYVDLDLPSGTLWGNRNVGSTDPKDPGLLFQWGRTDGYKFGDTNNKFENGKQYVNKWTNIELLDDAAYHESKGKFRMPTIKEINELLDKTDIQHEDNGVKFISKKDKTKFIFVPYTGVGFPSSGSKTNGLGEFFDEHTGVFWASDAETVDNVWTMIIDKDDAYTDTSYPYFACGIRPVINNYK